MPQSTLLERLRASAFAEHAELLAAHARPCIDLELADGPAEESRSRMGGAPDLPPDMPWPVGPTGPYRFLAQLHGPDLPRLAPGLPAEGRLVFFAAIDPYDGTNFARSPGYVRAFLFPAGTPLVRVPPPSEVAYGAARALRFRAGTDLPFDRHQMADWPLGTDYALRCAYGELRESLHTSPHYLLGYPAHDSLGYDPTPGPEWQSLLSLGSDAELEWEWQDAARLMVFIESSRLAQHDFAELRSDAG